MDFDNRKVYGDTSIADGLVYVIELVNKYYGGTIPRMMFTFQQALEAIKKDSVMSKSCSLQHDVYSIFRLILVDETLEMQGELKMREKSMSNS